MGGRHVGSSVRCRCRWLHVATLVPLLSALATLRPDRHWWYRSGEGSVTPFVQLSREWTCSFSASGCPWSVVIVSLTSWTMTIWWWQRSVSRTCLRDRTHKVCRCGFWASKGCPPPCSVFLSGQELPLVSEYPYLGVILTPSFLWTVHARHLVPWQPLVRSVRCLVQVRTSPVAVRVHPFHVLRAAEHVLGSGISRFISTRFAGDRHFFLGWPAGSPNVSIFSRLFSLSLAGCTRCLRVIGAFSLCLSSTPCFRCLSFGLRVVFLFVNFCAFPSLVTVVWGLGPLFTVCGWGSVLAPAPLTGVSMNVCSRLHPPCRSVMWIPVLPPSIVAPCSGVQIFSVALSFFGVWGHDLFPEGRAARHLVLSSSCPFCDAPHGDMFYCLSECAAFLDLRSGVVDVPCIWIPSHSGCGIHGKGRSMSVLCCRFQFFPRNGFHIMSVLCCRFQYFPARAPQHLAVGSVSSPSVLPARAPQPFVVVSLVLVWGLSGRCCVCQVSEVVYRMIVHVTQLVSSRCVSIVLAAEVLSLERRDCSFCPFSESAIGTTSLSLHGGGCVVAGCLDKFLILSIRI